MADSGPVKFRSFHCDASPRTGDVAKVNSTCEPTVYETAGRTLKWHLQCKGQLDMAVAGIFNFDTPLHYTAVIVTKGEMAGSMVSDRMLWISTRRIE